MNLTEIQVSNNGRDFIAVADKRIFRIDYPFYCIIKYVQKDCSLEEAIEFVATKNNLSKTDLHQNFIYFLNEINKTKKTRESYIKAKVNLCPEKFVIILSKTLKFLFSDRYFCILMTLGTVISFYFGALNGGLQRNIDFFNGFQIIILSILCFLCTFLHEVGHATASYYMGCPASNIGLGFYIFFPVFFTDVSKIWILPKKNRLIVNIGGIYFQILINIILVISYFITSNPSAKEWISYLFASNSIVIISSLLPFFRNDGYWILSDLTNIPNLLILSDRWFGKFVSGKNYRADYKIILFAVSNQMFRFWIISNLIVTIYTIVKDCIHSSSIYSHLTSIVVGIILSIALYLMCMTQIKNIIRYAKHN